MALSMHVGLEGSYNALHPHARCTVDDNIAGIFYNSEDKVSAYVGKEFRFDEFHSLEVGLVSGYEYADVVPMIRYKVGTWFISPAYEKLKSTGEENYGIVLGWEIGGKLK
jgi:hypothetical protein|tara:strand:- start:761 stop:1090 length:330 start_codon:yes stop_codon:yes gene_type:complete